MSNPNIDNESLESFIQAILDKKLSAKEAISQSFSKDLNLAYAGVYIIGYTALIVNKEGNPSVIPVDWINVQNVPNPNTLLENFLINLANHSLAVINLIESGYDFSARIILRALLELSWIAIYVVADRNTMQMYAQDLDDESERKMYNQLFGWGKLRTNLSRIEKNLEMPNDIVDVLSRARNHAYKYYSQIVHNSYPVVTIGAYGYSLEKDKTLEFGLFGVLSAGSKQTLYNLNEAIFYFIGMLSQVFVRVYGLQPTHSADWQEFFGLRRDFSNAFFEYAKEDG